MTVQELIDKLLLVDPKAQVMLEGCDCYGDAEDVDAECRWGEQVIPGTVLITRRES